MHRRGVIADASLPEIVSLILPRSIE
jgi:hypothetical protein